jgi:L-ascorbate metabolism protein UlaG (beta-lactamase superfamily)
MATERFFLKSNVVAEPLIDQWYAWSYLLSPASGALFTANLHVPLLKSFIGSPQIHAMAAANPALLGGNFIAHTVDKVPALEKLLAETLSKRAPQLALAAAIKSLNGLLREEARGFGLDTLYGRVPPELRGYVELCYDVNNQPHVRLIEPLLYRSPYYDETRQGLLLYAIETDDRPFAATTPRLPEARRVELRLPLRSEAVDTLFRMRSEPAPLGEIADALALSGEALEIFRSFLTTERPPAASRFTGEGVRARYFGHACILLETPEVSILTDPSIGYVVPGGMERYSMNDLPRTIDYVLLTHNHQDHVILENLVQLRHKIRRVVVPRNDGGSVQDPSLKLLLKTLGFRDVIELGELDSLPIPDGELIGLPFLGEHCDLEVHSKIAHLVRLKSRSFLLAADSCNVSPELYGHLRRMIGPIDVLYIGMECEGAPLSWLYSALMMTPLTRGMDQSRRLNGSDSARALQIVDELGPSRVYVYAMGQEPWMKYLMGLSYTPESRPIVESDLLVNTCRSRGLDSERLYGKSELYL